MRIQHNIMAMNAYRNYSNNTSALSKNLEKLSSGYKINRAGDDAAGLAISEKMRAQITGLDVAQKNAKDGISLVQTAEGALTEVHDMLNRMYEIAEQSANGTYEDATDREQLQKEVIQLKSEIDRIAESSNFNGIKLLNGDLANTKIEMTSATVNGADGTIADVAATGAVSTQAIGAGADGTTQKLTVEYAGADGKLKKVEVEYTSSTTANDNATAIRDALSNNAEISALFDVGGTAGNVTLTSKATGTDGAKVTKMSTDDMTATAIGALTFQDGENAKTTLEGLDTLIAGDSFTLNGKTYTFVDKAGDKVADGETAIVLGQDEGATVAAIDQALKGSGINATLNQDGTTLELSADKNGAGLTLQVGDTSETFNQLNVTVKDCHTTAIGVDGVDIGNQAGAAAALDTIKAAINYVSDVRGTLGATQNRLDHTINNLSVMEENIQDAESTIRDTDVADEMMAYTKNNILIQSAQAMLAQANQVPQGVLQLLQ